MKILALETSCDETGAAVVEGKNREQAVRVLSNVTATSLAIHAATGGIIPENAAREQIKYIIPTIVEALLKSEKIEQGSPEENFRNANMVLKKKIDAVAVTHGPGLIGSLLVGVETAKTLSFSFNKPIVPVHHLLAHLFANFIQTVNRDPRSVNFPFIGLIVSGGHTDLLLFKSLTNFKWLGGTRDDAAGEALDKIGRQLNLPYPAGPEIEKRANKVAKSSIKFKSPLIDTEDFGFSFSGLKAEVGRFIQTDEHKTENWKNEICYAVQTAIFDVLVKKTIRATKMFGVKQILLGGGVSANQTLRTRFELEIKNLKLKTKIFVPERVYATDNAAMIGSYAALNYKPIPWKKVTAEPDLYFD